jgi:4-hydroxy-3-methylbut-2-enyl diphosphate reductase IspH
MAREQDAAALNQTRDAQCQSKAARQKTIEDLAKLGRAISTAVAGLGVSLGPVTPETLVEEVGRLPGAVRELELATTRRAVHRVLAMFESHYQGWTAWR